MGLALFLFEFIHKLGMNMYDIVKKITINCNIHQRFLTNIDKKLNIYIINYSVFLKHISITNEMRY